MVFVPADPADFDAAWGEICTRIANAEWALASKKERLRACYLEGWTIRCAFKHIVEPIRKIDECTWIEFDEMANAEGDSEVAGDADIAEWRHQLLSEALAHQFLTRASLHREFASLCRFASYGIETCLFVHRPADTATRRLYQRFLPWALDGVLLQSTDPRSNPMSLPLIPGATLSVRALPRTVYDAMPERFPAWPSVCAAGTVV